ncbi:Metallo-hydrolase/oxidoreductase [Teratosphaeria nubilosa]|uniref:Metallo-hydrolase/oxidoreductase n=1 Tax=Teratosphaeria nubilosa TaxID=161662 RepID=A0A6G1LFX1_9PEZI|nr:Metallo-hydrolase/oxidoreductase [Teratosphaeria nubilosa]
MSSTGLPAARPDQKYVTVSPMAGGYITLQDKFFVSQADPEAKRTVPSLAFLIQHPGTSAFGGDSSKPFRMMFDLGLRKTLERYPKPIQDHLETKAVPCTLGPGIAAQLAAGGLDPANVNLIMISHVHYDHHGDPEDFPASQFLLGPGAKHLLQHGLGGIASHQHFDAATFPSNRTSELPPTTDETHWQPLSPFPHALDLFNDSSAYVIDTPGHLPGHINLLCRTPKGWVMLCGDAFHDRRILTGEKGIGTWVGAGGREMCIHYDKEVAAESVGRLRELASMGVEVVAGHEDGWWEGMRGRGFPGTL